MGVRCGPGGVSNPGSIGKSRFVGEGCRCVQEFWEFWEVFGGEKGGTQVGGWQVVTHWSDVVFFKWGVSATTKAEKAAIVNRGPVR